jgi:hypothetical protein
VFAWCGTGDDDQPKLKKGPSVARHAPPAGKAGFDPDESGRDNECGNDGGQDERPDVTCEEGAEECAEGSGTVTSEERGKFGDSFRTGKSLEDAPERREQKREADEREDERYQFREQET